MIAPELIALPEFAQVGGKKRGPKKATKRKGRKGRKGTKKRGKKGSLRRKRH
jgi:hypothetical protein